MRGASQLGFSLFMAWMRSRTSGGTTGQLGLPRRIFPARTGKMLAVPRNHCSGLTMISDERRRAHTRDSQTHRIGHLRATAGCVFPKGEEVLVGSLCLDLVSRLRQYSAELQTRHCTYGLVHHNARVIEDLLELRRV